MEVLGRLVDSVPCQAGRLDRQRAALSCHGKPNLNFLELARHREGVRQSQATDMGGVLQIVRLDAEIATNDAYATAWAIKAFLTALEQYGGNVCCWAVPLKRMWSPPGLCPAPLGASRGPPPSPRPTRRRTAAPARRASAICEGQSRVSHHRHNRDKCPGRPRC